MISLSEKSYKIEMFFGGKNRILPGEMEGPGVRNTRQAELIHLFRLSAENVSSFSCSFFCAALAKFKTNTNVGLVSGGCTSKM